MLSFNTHPEVVKEMQDIINSGKFFSITFIKADNSLRYVNGHKIIYQSTSPETELRGKFNRFDKNILLIWDNNKINDVTGEKGAYISARLDKVLYFKSGAFIRDFIEENQDAIRAARITPNQLQQVKVKMKIDGIVQEEIQNLFETPELMGLQELAQFLSQVDPDNYPLDMMIEMLQQEYQNGGDEAVVNYLKKYAGLNLQILGKGKYAFKY
jgi:hypothetical protein